MLFDTIIRTVLKGQVCKVEQQVCCKVEFDDGSVCDSLPQSDLTVSFGCLSLFCVTPWGRRGAGLLPIMCFL